MVYPTLSSMNVSEGLYIPFLYVAQTIDIFIPLVLFAFFFIIAYGSFYAQKRSSGEGDFPVSLVVASFSTTIMAILMSLIEGLIISRYVIITVVIAIFSFIFLVFSRKR